METYYTSHSTDTTFAKVRFLLADHQVWHTINSLEICAQTQTHDWTTRGERAVIMSTLTLFPSQAVGRMHTFAVRFCVMQYSAMPRDSTHAKKRIQMSPKWIFIIRFAIYLLRFREMPLTAGQLKNKRSHKQISIFVLAFGGPLIDGRRTALH